MANVFISGPRSAIGRISSAPSRSPARIAACTIVKDLPRMISGTSGSGGI
jgi:hypothetical protein